MLVKNGLLRRLLMGKRYKTVDRGAQEVYAPTRIGARQSVTPEGFLLCEDVPIARTGTMVYMGGEVPVRPGDDGLSRVTRDAATLFDARTIASFAGKPVTDDHPAEDVTPSNWRGTAGGIVLNPRASTEDGVLLADLLVTDAALIRAIKEGKREVSAGYAADYEQTGPGMGRQTNIIANHVALVARGRCGPRCAIGDGSTAGKGKSMATKKRVALAERVKAAFRDAGEELAGSLAEEAGGDDDRAVHVHVHGGPQPVGEASPMNGGPPAGDAGNMGDGDGENGAPASVEERIGRLETAVEGIAAAVAQLVGGGAPGGEAGAGAATPPPEGGASPEPKPGETKDSMALATSYQRMLSDAEVLVPGVRMPTFDAAATRVKTVDAMCAFRRGVLSQLAMTVDGTALLNSVGGALAADAQCDAVAIAFGAAAALRRAMNNRDMTRDAKSAPLGTAAPQERYGMPPVPTPDAMTKSFRDFWAKH